MNLLTDELAKHIDALEKKIGQHEALSDEDFKILLLNLLQKEDAHENE